MSEDRRYDEACADSARKALEAFVKESGGQEEAATALGVKQATISRNLNGPGQPTLKILIALRRKTGLTIDEMLGFPPTALQGSLSNAEFADRLRTIIRVIEAQPAPPQVKSRTSSRGAKR